MAPGTQNAGTVLVFHGTISAGRLRMEALTPELERRLQVEELWARREVLAESINARRLEYFQARRILLTRLGTAAESAPASDKPEEPVQQQDSSSKPLDLRHGMPAVELPIAITARSFWWIGAAAATTIVLVLGTSIPLTELASTARVEFNVFLPRIVRLVQSHEQAPAPSHLTHASLSVVDPPDLRAEVAAEIADALPPTAIGSVPHRAQGRSGR